MASKDKKGDDRSLGSQGTTAAQSPPSGSNGRYRVLILAILLPLLYFVDRSSLASRFSIDGLFNSSKTSHLDRAHKILKNNPLVDGHNDLLIHARVQYGNNINNGKLEGAFRNGTTGFHTDVAKIRDGHYGGAFWSAYYPCPLDVSDFSSEAYDPSTFLAFSNLPSAFLTSSIHRAISSLTTGACVISFLYALSAALVSLCSNAELAVIKIYQCTNIDMYMPSHLTNKSSHTRNFPTTGLLWPLRPALSRHLPYHSLWTPLQSQPNICPVTFQIRPLGIPARH